MKCIDVSNYSNVPTADQLACLRGAGYTRAVVGCSYGTVARAQLEAFISGGLEVEAYAFVDFGGNWQAPIDRALAAIKGLDIQRLWLDCEQQPGAGYTKAATAGRIGAALDYVINSHQVPKVGIYTAAWWWTPNVGESVFTNLPLWFASYLDAPDVNHPPLFGGWTSAAMWQFRGSVDICGLNADDNLIIEEEDGLMSAEYDKLKAALDAMYGALISLANHVYATDDPKLADMQKKIDGVKEALNK